MKTLFILILLLLSSTLSEKDTYTPSTRIIVLDEITIGGTVFKSVKVKLDDATVQSVESYALDPSLLGSAESGDIPISIVNNQPVPVYVSFTIAQAHAAQLFPANPLKSETSTGNLNTAGSAMAGWWHYYLSWLRFSMVSRGDR